MAEETKHTPEPWKVSFGDGNVIERADGDCADVVAMRFTPVGHEPHYSLTLSDANAARIVACVNACAGLSNEALKSGVVGELIAIAQAVASEPVSEYQSCHAEMCAPEECSRCGPILRARALLSRLPKSEVEMEGRKPVSGHVPLVPECRHKFVDSKNCLKCGWEPEASR